MDKRYFLAAAALLGIAVVLAIAEPALLGPPLDPRRGGWLSTAIQHAPAFCAWLAAACVVAGRWPIPWRRWRAGARVFLASLPSRGIPVAGARAVAAFRIAFGLGLMYVLSFTEIDGFGTLQLGTLSALVAFTAGAFARISLVAATAGIWTWMLIWTERFGTHPVSALTLALPALWPARWADAWSVDAMWRRRAPEPASIAYGYALWMPRLALGLALLAAALAKIATEGWIANGTVKFAFVADYGRASVPWGLWIAIRPSAAVAVSAAAVAIEALAITAAFARSWRYRAVVGLLVAALFLGFFLLQGELWRGWWLLLAAFAPWELVGRPARVDALERGRLRPAQRTMIALLVLTQAAASAANLEIRPAVSAYDMYSTTFRSTAAFDAANPMLAYRFEAETGDGMWIEVTECFERPASVKEAEAWGANASALRQALSACTEQSVPRVRRLRLLESLRIFDWKTGKFSWRYRDRERWTLPL